MSDGRQIIDETYNILKEVPAALESQKAAYEGGVYETLRGTVESSLEWAKKCRNKVWLRSKEGTDLAQGCLDYAKELSSSLGQPEKATDAAYSLLYKLEGLAKIISTKASVMT